MSTFLVSLGVLVLAVACVTCLALRGADQTATTRNPSRRALPPERAPAHRPPPASSVSSRTPVSPFPHHTLRTGADVPTPREPASARAKRDVVNAPVGRLRAGLALSVLVTFVGVIVALTIAGGIVFIAEGLRTAVR